MAWWVLDTSSITSPVFASSNLYERNCYYEERESLIFYDRGSRSFEFLTRFRSQSLETELLESQAILTLFSEANRLLIPLLRSRPRKKQAAARRTTVFAGKGTGRNRGFFSAAAAGGCCCCCLSLTAFINPTIRNINFRNRLGRLFQRVNKYRSRGAIYTMFLDSKELRRVWQWIKWQRFVREWRINN